MTDVFNLIPGNPLPEKATGGYFAGFDGKKLRYGRFPAVARLLKGTVIVLPGRNECNREIFRNREKPVRARLHHRRSSTGAAKAAPIGCCAIRSAAMSGTSATT